MAVGPAMTRQQAERALEVGVNALAAEMDPPLNLVGVGDMGIGNTTPSAAIIAAFTGRPLAEVTGRGTGIGDAQLAHKTEVIARALAVNRPDPTEATDVLAKVGGFEIGAMAGACIGGAAHNVPVVVDGFIATAAALLAEQMCPGLRAHLFFSHRSAEGGFAAVLDRCGIRPVLDLDLRLGEGTGAALAMNVIDSALALFHQMATFASAGVSEKIR